MRWKAPLPGSGNSSPIATADRVFLTSVVGQGHRRQLRVIALDRTTGSVDWYEDVGRPVGTTHQRNGHASATMATDGERVFACFGAKGLFCYTVAGDLLWHRAMRGQVHEWGSASSPTLIGPLVVQLVELQTDSYLVALDAETGEQRWKTPRASDGCWTTPVIAWVNEGWQIVVNGSGSRDGSSGSVQSYDPATGELLWSIEGTRDIVCPTAIVGDGLIVSTSGANGPIFAIETDGFRSSRGGAPEIRWRLPNGGPYVPTGVIAGGRLFVVDDDGLLSCISLDEGKRLWRERLGSPVSASLVAAPGRIYATTESGDVFVVATGDEYQLLAKNSLHELCLATPAIAGDELIVRGERHLFCFVNEQSDAGETPTTEASPSDLPAN